MLFFEPGRDSSGGNKPAEGLGETLATSESLVASLDRAPLPEIMRLLPPSLQEAVTDLAWRVRRDGPGRMLIDSDGTAFLIVQSGDQEKDARCYQLLRSQRRVFPGGAIDGEAPQDYTYDLRIFPGQIEVWQRLAAHGLAVGVLSGRKENDLQATYAAAIAAVPNFVLLPSKGRVALIEGVQCLLPELETLLTEDPLRTAAARMGAIITEQIAPGAETTASASSTSGFERLTGYRVSLQEAAGRVVMIRLHHRHRACALAQAAGCPVEHVDRPDKVDGKRLEEWLASPAGAGVLAQLQREDAWIKAALGGLAVGIKDRVGYRSLSQDIAFEVSYASVLAGAGPVYAYAGDHWEPGGNDQPVMEALRGLDPEAILIGVGDLDRPRDPDMAAGNQYELFLMTYAVDRVLGSEWEGQLAPIPPEALAGAEHGFLAAYAALYNKTAAQARKILARCASLEEISEYRAGLPATDDVSQAQLPQAPEEQLAFLDAYAKRRIGELAQAQAADPRIQEIAADLAFLTLEYEVRRNNVHQALGALTPQLRHHIGIMAEARRTAWKLEPETRFAKMFLEALDRKAALNGYRPPLITFHDMDGNVAPTEDYNHQKPSADLDVLLDTVLHPLVPTLQIGPRVPLIHLLHEGRGYSEAAAAIYRRCGRLIDTMIYSDARRAAVRASGSGAGFRILTTNLAACAEGVADVMAQPAARFPIDAVSLQSMAALDKPLVLAQAFTENPDALLVMVDDGNAALREALSHSNALPGFEFPVPLEDLVFFAARIPGDGEAAVTQFPLQRVLTQLQVPFAPNHRETKDGEQHGYQGFYKILELYDLWCRTNGSRYPTKGEFLAARG